MLDAPRVADCVAAMRAAVEVPVTVKTRLGVDEHDSYEFLTGFVEPSPLLVRHVHGPCAQGLAQRPEPEGESRDPAARLPARASLEARLPRLRIVINGGLGTRHCLAQLEHVDGVMLGRAAYQQPWLVRGARSRGLFGGRAAAARSRVLERFLSYVERELAAGSPLRSMTRHLLGLRAGQAGGRRWRRDLSELRTATRVSREFAKSRAVDARPPMTPASEPRHSAALRFRLR